MKPYLLISGILFAMVPVVHIWRSIAEWPPHIDGQFLSMHALTLLGAALSAWAFVLFFRRRA